MTSTTATLRTADLHPSLTDPSLSSMNFLNEIANRYPDAISFAPGRPAEEFFDVEALHRYLRTYCRYLTEQRGLSAEQVRRTLFQYGRTKGVVHELVARNLAVDENIVVDPESIVVTVGCQEAMFLVLRALRADERDVLLAVTPTYVGLTGAARLVGLPVLPVRGGPAGIDLDDLTDQVRQARAAGLRPRTLYVMPDFANPSGVSMSVPVRHQLIHVAEREGLLLLEDNPYGLFHMDSAHLLPPLKALDRDARVVYLGSYAKTAFPGARVGFVIADQLTVDDDGHHALFADQLSKIKSMITVNTPPTAQAMVAGMLLEHDCSMVAGTHRVREVYERNLRQVLAGLARRFPPGGRHQVTWNSPAGGFFVVVTVPFDADDELLAYSAEEYGVLWTPMHHFYDGTIRLPQIRLSVSSLGPAEIEHGLDRLHTLITHRARQVKLLA